MTEPAIPFRETVAKLVGDGITRHINGVTSTRHNRTAIATVARQVSEDIEAVALAATERLDIDLTAARNEVGHQQRVIDDQRTRITAQAGVIDLMRPVVEYVSRGRSAALAPYPDATARRALGALDDAVLNSPQVREWLANTKPPVGPGKVDTPAALQQRIDAAVPEAITELRAEVAAARERDEALTDRLIDAWHDGHGGTLTLHAYLGLTWDEYCVRFGPVKPTDPVCTADVPGLACNGIHLTTTPAVPKKEPTP